MVRLALVTLCVTVTIAGIRAERTLLDYGMDMSDVAYGAVCWYENLKKFPETNSKKYGECSTTAKQMQAFIENPSEQNKEYFKDDPKNAESMYGDSMVDNAMGNVPEEYKTACTKYLKDANADPPADESDTLNDEGTYPFKGFAHCMIQTLRSKNGDGAIEAVKNERTKKHKHWRTTLAERENEFRVRHGADPLKNHKDLNDAAQAWADKNAKECKMYHSKNKDAGRQWRDKSTGESLSAGHLENNRDAAYVAADGWYEENKDYPWPEYTGDGGDELFGKIGHFTQSVWKESKYVGYGYAYNPDCSGYKSYVAARYSPPGNMPGDFGKNVAPAE